LLNHRQLPVAHLRLKYFPGLGFLSPYVMLYLSLEFLR
jgi:hypothetical protein